MPSFVGQSQVNKVNQGVCIFDLYGGLRLSFEGEKFSLKSEKFVLKSEKFSHYSIRSKFLDFRDINPLIHDLLKIRFL